VHAAADVPDHVDGVHAVVAGQFFDVGEPHHRGGTAARQQHDGGAVLSAADLDPRAAVAGRHIDAADLYGPPPQDGVVRLEENRLVTHSPHPKITRPSTISTIEILRE
jgi:hypothetical protein